MGGPVVGSGTAGMHGRLRFRNGPRAEDYMTPVPWYIQAAIGLGFAVAIAYLAIHACMVAT